MTVRKKTQIYQCLMPALSRAVPCGRPQGVDRRLPRRRLHSPALPRRLGEPPEGRVPAVPAHRPALAQRRPQRAVDGRRRRTAVPTGGLLQRQPTHVTRRHLAPHPRYSQSRWSVSHPTSILSVSHPTLDTLSLAGQSRTPPRYSQSRWSVSHPTLDTLSLAGQSRTPPRYSQSRWSVSHPTSILSVSLVSLAPHPRYSHLYRWLVSHHTLDTLSLAG